jgi:LacI family transcriptional regulator
MTRRVTLKDVAREVGVHVSTVSRALDANSTHAVSAGLAEAVERASRKLGYRRNAVGYGLRTNKTRSVGITVPDITDPIFPPILRGIEDVLTASGYVAIIVNTDNDLKRESDAIEMLRARGVDGLIIGSASDGTEGFLSGDLADFPVVAVNRLMEGSAFPAVVADEVGGMQAIVTHLFLYGHRRIAAIAGPQNLSTGRRRHEGFLAACRKFHLDGGNRVAFSSAYREEEGERCAEALLASSKGLTALVCANDRLAVGAMAVLQRNGLNCPGDISVTGFNDMVLVDRLAPPLTTVHVSSYDIGVRAGQTLLASIEGGRDLEKLCELPVSVAVRGSTRKIG